MDLDDRELLEELIIESQEHLSAIEPDLLALEKDVDGAETEDRVNRIFRGIHSIKGGCGFLGIETVQNLTHQMESALMRVRSGKLAVTSQLVDVLLEGTDRVREMLADLGNSSQVDASAVYAALEPFLADDNQVRQADLDAAPVMVEQPRSEVPQPVDSGEAAAADTEIPEMPVKTSGFIPLTRKLPPEAQELNPVPPAPAPAQTVPEQMVVATPAIPSPAVTPPPRTEDTPAAFSGRSSHSEVLRVKVDLLNQLMNLAGELVLARNQIVQSVDNKLAETPGGEALFSATRNTVEDSLRRLRAMVTEQRQQQLLDDESARILTDHIGREFSELQDNLTKAFPTRLSDLSGMNATVVNIDTVTTNLQENIMRTRLQSIDAVFGKLPRQVRQLAKQVGKEVALDVSGNEVELDKSIIEALSDPLTHLIRNSLDHGLEDPAGRQAAGKQAAGRLAVRAFHEGGQVIIEIEDDGRGINPDIIKQKALEKGVISEGEAQRLDNRQAQELIFAPGFSTAEQVSDISGRGVGMDVVRTNIEDLGGAIDLDSQLGRGTRMRLKLPLTLAIIPSLLVRSAGRRFAVPQMSLDELVRLRNGDKKNRIEEVQGAEVLRLRGKLLPLVRLNGVLGLPEAEPSAEAGRATHILVLKAGNHRYGLVVDEVLDSEEIVVKQLPGALKDTRCYAGATIMGDGSVAMILDVVGISDFAGLRFIESSDELGQEHPGEAYIERTEGQTLLLFNSAAGGEQFALNLSLISRIEEIPSSDIQVVGGKEFLKYQDSTLRLIRLQDYLPVAVPDHEPEEVYVIIPKLVRHPIGIIAHDCHDVVTTRAEVERNDVKDPGLLGSAVLDGVLTLFLDIFSLFEMADPEVYRQESYQAASVEGARVLLAEDTSFFRAVEKKYIESLGATVVSTKDGQEAWNVLCGEEEHFDLVVTDLEMPLMDGLELTRRIRSSQRWGGIPVVALTSLGSDANRQAGYDAGVTAYETKLDKEKLAATLRQVMEGVCAHA